MSTPSGNPSGLNIRKAESNQAKGFAPLQPLQPSSRHQSGKDSNPAARMARNQSRSHADPGGNPRESLSIDRKPALINKAVTSSQNNALHQLSVNPPAPLPGSMPQAQQIYGYQSSQNRNYRGNKKGNYHASSTDVGAPYNSKTTPYQNFQKRTL